MPKFLRAAYFALIVALPAVLFFSYYPIISLGANSSMNFELSLPLLWLVLFDLISLANFVIFLKDHKTSPRRSKTKEGNKNMGFKGFCEGIRLGLAPRSGPSKKPLNPIFSSRGPERSSKKTIIKVLILLLFPLYATLSVFWSANPLRTILTSGILWLLFFAIFAILRLSPLLEPPHKLKIWVLGAFFASTAVICLFCFIQSDRKSVV